MSDGHLGINSKLLQSRLNQDLQLQINQSKNQGLNAQHFISTKDEPGAKLMMLISYDIRL